MLQLTVGTAQALVLRLWCCGSPLAQCKGLLRAMPSAPWIRPVELAFSECSETRCCLTTDCHHSQCCQVLLSHDYLSLFPVLPSCRAAITQLQCHHASTIGVVCHACYSQCCQVAALPPRQHHRSCLPRQHHRSCAQCIRREMQAVFVNCVYTLIVYVWIGEV